MRICGGSFGCSVPAAVRAGSTQPRRCVGRRTEWALLCSSSLRRRVATGQARFDGRRAREASGRRFDGLAGWQRAASGCHRREGGGRIAGGGRQQRRGRRRRQGSGRTAAARCFIALDCGLSACCSTAVCVFVLGLRWRRRRCWSRFGGGKIEMGRASR